MSFSQLADQDFDKAVRKSFFRRILTRISGESNELLPYDEVKDKLKIQGQSYIGMRQVEIKDIIGSVGRYRDFDRIFLPTQKVTKARWTSIDQAHYEYVPLPPVELYKIGEAYFVKDGNHRVSVARERGQEFIDAYVTEIKIPVQLTTDTTVEDLDLIEENAEFMLQTGIKKIRPQAEIEITTPGLYNRILEHIAVHRWYLGEQQGEEVAYSDAVASWFDNVYSPVIAIIREHELLNAFPGLSETDLYLWILEYAGYTRQLYRGEDAEIKDGKKQAEKVMISLYPNPATRKLIKIANRNEWLQELILEQERVEFYRQTSIRQTRPDANIACTLAGQYDQLIEHIAVHRWYLGEQVDGEVAYEDAVGSWYDNVYAPIVSIIQENDIMRYFEGRTETDLYIWILRRQDILEEIYAGTVPIEEAIKQAKDTDGLDN